MYFVGGIGIETESADIDRYIEALRRFTPRSDKRFAYQGSPDLPTRANVTGKSADEEGEFWDVE